ncbi:MAG: Ig-like domain-containing protein [Eubacterium sp.]|nr:Ig-like domain-containing protein [Eubacterium sp.]
MNKCFKVFLLFASILLLGLGAGAVKADAASTYKIKVNKQQNVVTVYKYTDGKYKAFKAFVCSAGYATPTGTFSLGEKMRWHTLDGPSYGQYCSRIYNGFLFHSVWYYNQTKNSQSYAQYNKLGSTASHGCVRLTVADAKWIYDNVPSGTKIVIYNSSKPGPLGKPKAIKVSGYSGWDPTDPDPANPYKKKKPTITIDKQKNIAYGSKFKVKKGVTVKNSTGFNAKSLLKVKIYYRLDKTSSYKKVKKVNTKKPGYYKVVYKVTDEIKHKAKKTKVYKVLTAVSVGSITLNKTKKTLYLGSTASKAKFTLKVKSILPKKATSKKVQYISGNKNIATVSQKGVVKAKSAGTVTITVKAKDGSGTYATCTVTVKQKMTGLTLTAASQTLDVGNAMQLKTTVTPSNTSNKELTYTSSDASVATVSESGSVKALAPGTVTITAVAKDGSGVKATYTITVAYKYGQVVDSLEARSLAYGTSLEEAMALLPATVTIADANQVEAQATVTWTCPDYQAETPGTYTATGKITLPEGWMGNPDKLSLELIVAEKEDTSSKE